MLTANWNGSSVDAATSAKGFSYHCPECGHAVTLRKGQIKVAHFAHKPPADCYWAKGETAAHLEAKVALRDAFRRLGYVANYEVNVLSIQGDRRADVFVTSPDGQSRWAFEIQHTPILYPAIEARTKAYIAAQVPVLWVGILSPEMKENSKPTPGGIVISKYSIKPWEKWAKALGYNELWYVDPSDGSLWRGEFGDHTIDVASATWYETGGVERSVGGYTRKSKRWRTLTLHGPHGVHQLTIGAKWRTAWSSPAFSLPQGMIASLTVV
ncbi:hypothetical protein BJF93_20480 [Xaviernesmea oryzae]|uniref:Competence protein CoiA n=1 Tax=Xaviernesmea oryzae TaxID=464029 RepID=A0A1Q9AVU7_9HYPH|nr:competence protein CoiA family protein [Xaviernesmea oryzae]OLP59591.1 hypothetical protein BJF93_20480 [Xaviernesmea oryzae]SEM12701.1 competence protein CoiA [Xaviernesmea oryzae]